MVRRSQVASPNNGMLMLMLVDLLMKVLLLHPWQALASSRSVPLPRSMQRSSSSTRPSNTQNKNNGKDNNVANFLDDKDSSSFLESTDQDEAEAADIADIAEDITEDITESSMDNIIDNTILAEEEDYMYSAPPSTTTDEYSLLDGETTTATPTQLHKRRQKSATSLASRSVNSANSDLRSYLLFDGDDQQTDHHKREEQRILDALVQSSERVEDGHATTTKRKKKRRRTKRKVRSKRDNRSQNAERTSKSEIKKSQQSDQPTKVTKVPPLPPPSDIATKVSREPLVEIHAPPAKLSAAASKHQPEAQRKWVASPPQAQHSSPQSTPAPPSSYIRRPTTAYHRTAPDIASARRRQSSPLPSSNVSYQQSHQRRTPQHSSYRHPQQHGSSKPALGNAPSPTATIEKSANVLPAKSTASPTVSPIPTAAASTTSPWVRRYLAGRPKDVLLPIPLEFIADGFNLHQLPPIIERVGLQLVDASKREDIISQIVIMYQKQQQQQEGGSKEVTTSTSTSQTVSYPIYRQALKRILQLDDDEAAINTTTTKKKYNAKTNDLKGDNVVENIAATDQQIIEEVIHHAAEALYLLIHARFVTSPRGLDTMRRILTKPSSISSAASSEPLFGRCSSQSCHGMPLLPTGPSDDFDHRQHSRKSHCQRYCTCCGRVWYFWDSKTDGCAWGTSFCHLFLFTYGHNVFPDILKQRSERQERILQEEMVNVPSLGIDGNGDTTIADSNKIDRSQVVQPTPRIYGYPVHPSSPWGLLMSD